MPAPIIRNGPAAVSRTRSNGSWTCPLSTAATFFSAKAAAQVGRADAYAKRVQAQGVADAMRVFRLSQTDAMRSPDAVALRREMKQLTAGRQDA